MIHQYKLGGMNVVLDVCSGAVHVVNDVAYDIIAATGCPTGIAHTFMAKKAMEMAAEAKGLSIKVETHGQVGIEDELTAQEIRVPMCSKHPS